MLRLTGRVAIVTGCGGQRGAGRGIARRLASEGADLVVTDVAPQGTRTQAGVPDGGYDEALRAEGIRQKGAAVPLGRLATPQDVAAAVAFLASDDAEFVTGEAINVSGGLLMC